MRFLFANTCWPNRYLTRWMSVFSASIAFGALLAAFLAPPVIEVKAKVFTRVYYTDIPQGELTAARIYLDKRAPADADRNDSFYVPETGISKRLVRGGRDFIVQPVQRKRSAGEKDVPLGQAEYQRYVWHGGTIVFKIHRPYPKRPENPRSVAP